MAKSASLMLAAVILAGSLSTADAQPVVEAPAPSRPVYVLGHVDVPPDPTAEAAAAIRRYVAGAKAEPGALQVDAMQELRPNHFDVIEVWRDQAAFQAHQASPATRRFHDVIAPWRGSPFEERLGARLN